MEVKNFDRVLELVAASAEPCEKQVAAKAVKWELSQHVVYNHLRMCDHKGSDVRLNPSQIFRPHAWPRTSLDMKQWTWKVLQSYAFKQTQHINVLEMRAILNYMRMRCRDTRKHRARMLLIVDSQVVCSVVAKSRSSSQQLNAVLQRMSGLVIATDTRIAVGWSRSDPIPPTNSLENYAAEVKAAANLGRWRRRESSKRQEFILPRHGSAAKDEF